MSGALFVDAAAACLLTSPEGTIVGANRAAHVLLGRAAGTLSGFTLDEAGLHIEVSQETSECAPSIVTFAHPAGEQLILECVARPLQTGSGEKAKIAWWITDVTERFQAEAALEEAKKRVRQSERLETLGTLAGALAHDFNNLLAPIIGNVELVMLDIPEGSISHDDLKTVHTAALRAAELASRLLHLSRPERDSIEAVRIQDIMSEAIALLSAGQGQSVEFVARIDDGCPAILGTRTRLHQVLFNLCKNAIQAMPGGGMLTTVVEFTESPVNMKHRPGEGLQGGFVRVIITDTGTGMSAETVDRVFEPFFTTKAEGSGSGLGLSMVKSIVAGYGGSIELKSVLGKGSSFTLIFPAIGETPPE